MRIRTSLAVGALALLTACVRPGGPTGGSTFDLVVAATTDVHGRLRGWNYESDRPDPDPPAMPMTSGFTDGCGRCRAENVAEIVTGAKARGVSRLRIRSPGMIAPRAGEVDWKGVEPPDRFRG